jgi:hypothetical protein
MVDDNLPRPEDTPRPDSGPGRPAVAPIAETVVSIAEQAAPAEPEPAAPSSPVAVAEPERAESERERWFRERFDREHEVLLSLTRLLISGLDTESRAMRFWRWLIDDLRSERRLTADFGTNDEETRLVRRVVAWFRERRFDRSSPIPPRYGEPSGLPSGGESTPP